MRLCTTIFFYCLLLPVVAAASSFELIKSSGVIRHLGVPYAHFVTGSGDGLDVELMKRFAKYLGVEYRYVQSTWRDIFRDSFRKEYGRDLEKGQLNKAALQAKGDVIANGLTILEERKGKVLFSHPTFPSGVWLVARADSSMTPIVPSGDRETDIQSTINQLKGNTVLALRGGCLDPSLNRIEGTGAKIKYVTPETNLNDLVPMILKGEAESSLLDVPDALLEIQKWPGKIMVIGPLSVQQYMGVAFTKSSEKLRNEFNEFFFECVRQGEYEKLVKKYYPSIHRYYPEFFKTLEATAEQHR